MRSMVRVLCKVNGFSLKRNVWYGRKINCFQFSGTYDPCVSLLSLKVATDNFYTEKGFDGSAEQIRLLDAIPVVETACLMMIGGNRP